jgi:hypothetical protein
MGTWLVAINLERLLSIPMEVAIKESLAKH